jgi:hypothetical protein
MNTTQDDHAEFNARFESIRVAAGPHLPLSIESANEYRSRIQAAIDRFWAAVAK